MSQLCRILRTSVCLTALIVLAGCQQRSLNASVRSVDASSRFEHVPSTPASLPSTPAEVDTSVVVAGFGDSIVYGYYLEHPWLYRMLERIQPSAGITYVPVWPWVMDQPERRHESWYESSTTRVYNMGIGGNTTTQMADRFSADVLPVEPDYCIISGGVNDLLAGEPVATIESNLANLYASCAAAGITPVPCTITPVRAGSIVGSQEVADGLNRQIAQLNAWIASQGYRYIDFQAALAGDPTLLADDGVHPTQAGHDRMGSFAAAYFDRWRE